MSRREAKRWVAATCILGAAVISVVAAEPRTAGADAANTAAQDLRTRAEHLAVRGEVGEALDLATLAANLSPNDPESWRLLAKMHSAAGRDDDHVTSTR